MTDDRKAFEAWTRNSPVRRDELAITWLAWQAATAAALERAAQVCEELRDYKGDACAHVIRLMRDESKPAVRAMKEQG